MSLLTAEGERHARSRADRLGLVGNDYLLSNESGALDRIRLLRAALLPAQLLVRSRS